jgi:hypothetical protein
VERAEAAVAAAGGVEFRVEVEDPVSHRFDQSQIGISTNVARDRLRSAEVAPAVEQFAQEIFEVTASFIDPGQVLDGTISRVHSLNDFIQDRADALHYALVGLILRVDCHSFAPVVLGRLRRKGGRERKGGSGKKGERRIPGIKERGQSGKKKCSP